MKTTPRTEADAIKASRRTWPPDIYNAHFIEAVETESQAGNEMIRVRLVVADKKGDEREFTDYLTNSGALKLRHACQAVGALAKFEAGEITAEDFPPGHACKVRIGIEKRVGYNDKNVILDYIVTASTSRVVDLRQARP